MSKPYEVERIESAEVWDGEREAWDGWTHHHLFCGFDWLRRWWEHFGDDAKLFVLKITHRDDGPVAYLPWQCRRSIAAGRVLSFLGSGRVCSDYMTLPGRTADRAAWLQSAVDWLGTHDEWDVIDLTGAVQGDAAVETFIRLAQDAGWSVGRRTPMSCWRIALPAEWNDYLARLSKSHRKQLRRLVSRQLDSGAISLREPADGEDFRSAFDRLVVLHQARWTAAEEEGAFSDPAFLEFVRDVACAWFDQRRCRIFELVSEGDVVASEIHFVLDRVSYAYQSGVAPEARTMQAGTLLNAAVIRRLIEEGWEALDFLRGDEPYKAHFRALPTPLVAWRLAAPRAPARLRHTAWAAAHALKGWINGTGMTETSSHDG